DAACSIILSETVFLHLFRFVQRFFRCSDSNDTSVDEYVYQQEMQECQKPATSLRWRFYARLQAVLPMQENCSEPARRISQSGFYSTRKFLWISSAKVRTGE